MRIPGCSSASSARTRSTWASAIGEERETIRISEGSGGEDSCAAAAAEAEAEAEVEASRDEADEGDEGDEGEDDDDMATTIGRQPSGRS
ncbi:hypothetical protein GCM10009665_49100 [Kitasatospora nipponensis]|uniref:Uncharacterized protein n=1 Tax=Kitasatospora nipponensis TaxID=258049 RepID=A0ABN1WJJ7_9ACTN